MADQHADDVPHDGPGAALWYEQQSAARTAENVAGFDLLIAALSDPTIFFVEDEGHARDYWKRQAQRLMTLLDSDAWAAARFGPERWADGARYDGADRV